MACQYNQKVDYGNYKQAHQTSYPLIAVAIGNESIESILHKKFEEHRSHGEWFNDCTEITSFIEKCGHNSFIELSAKKTMGSGLAFDTFEVFGICTIEVTQKTIKTDRRVD